MKQLLFLFSFILLASFSANAQCGSKAATAGKSCCMSKKMSSADQNTENKDMASLSGIEAEAETAMQASNGNIVKKTCEVSGTTKYYGKSVNKAGEENWKEVTYDSNKKTFTEVASAYMEKDDAGKKVETKACAGEKAAEGKACSASKSATKSCCSSKK